MLGSVFDPDSPDYEGVPVWKLRTYPNSNQRFGGTSKVAAYLYFNVQVGETFRIADLRRELSDDEGHYAASALERRWRSLKEQGWRYASYKDEPGLPSDTYRLLAKGNRVWLGERTRRATISAAVRRTVFERDLNRCVICGIGRGEPYEDDPNSTARMTVGHRIAGARIADTSPDNLQTECSRCNEPVGDVPPNPEVFGEVMAAVSKLGSRDKVTLLEWIASGRRHRSKLDNAFDRVRRLSPSERAQVVEILREVTGLTQTDLQHGGFPERA
jgi:hypothetical protein